MHGNTEIFVLKSGRQICCFRHFYSKNTELDVPKILKYHNFNTEVMHPLTTIDTKMCY